MLWSPAREIRIISQSGLAAALEPLSKEFQNCTLALGTPRGENLSVEFLRLAAEKAHSIGFVSVPGHSRPPGCRGA